MNLPCAFGKCPGSLHFTLLTIGEIELENVSLSNTSNLRTVNTLTADNKYSLRNRENSQQRIQKQLSKKEKLFLNCLHHF